MWQNIIFSFLTSLALSFVAIPSIIAVAKAKHLYDEPGARKSHSENIPTLGGMAIFAAIIFSVSLWGDFSMWFQMQYVIASLVVLFFTGLKDDILLLSPMKKAMGQLLASAIVVVWGGVRISSFSGIFGVFEIPYIVSIFFSIFTIFVIINAYNMIDGINGLSASFGIIASLTFGAWFYITDQDGQFPILAFALAGALLGFLRFNVTPAKIFMGDTGSMILGFIMAVFAVKFIDFNETYTGVYCLHSSSIVAMGILFVPLIDLLRVFTLRISRRRSPFKPDKCHIHHILLKIGMSHTQATLTLSALSLLLIVISFMFDYLGNYYLGAILAIVYIAFIYMLELIKKNVATK
ncbi:MAG TPA: undecaprenyl/decaprenyl-phosphate alpha-N-acetylglucosaminyl 1-phosphate transferase [Bacteroidales bacterium]|nr:MAG: hypothetical protein A2W98_05065 [Bacteroidetes bacterium GWF2_33_38]HBF88276.1 undecaprenyl/decaprenyl-phosphate alpha-N-acetylglucosaminyl 1-phosphate transferase [Bacteroidales bacterium]